MRRTIRWKNYGEILMESALHDPSILETEGSLMSFYKFTPISEEEGRHYRQVFYDATVYIELEDEDEPVRVMCTAFRMPDGQYYELKLMISILERDDMVEAMLWYLGALFLLFLICTSIGIQLVLKGVFRPLHRLLDWLHCIQPGKGGASIGQPDEDTGVPPAERCCIGYGQPQLQGIRGAEAVHRECLA